MEKTFSKNVKAIFESTDKKAYLTIKSEIVRAQGAQVRLDAIVDSGIKAGANMIKNSLSLNRLNALCLALADCKETGRLARLARVPEYIRAQGVKYDKTNKVFYFSDYALAKEAQATIILPTMSYNDWLKANKESKVQFLTEDQADKKLARMLQDMQSSPYIGNNFQSVINTLREYFAANPKYQAANELENIRSIIR